MNVVTTNGIVLALTNSPELMLTQIELGGITSKAQYQGLKLSADLADNISTDEITPGWCCFWYDENLANFVYLGFRSKAIEQGDVKSIAPSVVVSGRSKGCGSSREHSPYAEKAAGVRIIVAKSFEKIYYQNCINIGLLPTTDFSILEDVFDGNDIAINRFTCNMSATDKAIVESGGLFQFNLHHHDTKEVVPLASDDCQLNMLEKITQHRLSKVPTARGEDGTFFCEVDLRFSHEYVTPMCASLFQGEFGSEASLNDNESIVCFQDHLTYLGDTLPADKAHLKAQAQSLIDEQAEFVERHDLKYYSGQSEEHSAAICHNAVLEDLALPGQVIIGTDSHTCTAGAIGALAFGVGATDMANSWMTKDVKYQSPKSVQIDLSHELPKWVVAKDIVIYLLAHELIQSGELLGSVLIYTGSGIEQLSMDERATIANMAVEMGAMTAIFEVDDVTIEYLQQQHNLTAAQCEGFRKFNGDASATYDYSIKVDLRNLSPGISLPGDPRNAHPLSNILDAQLNAITIDRAYGGSCTGGKTEDMDMYAKVIKHANQIGVKKPNDVSFYIQFGSDNVKRYCEEQQYITLFEDFGVSLIEPSCGACINAGPGVSKKQDEVTISSQNRNFPGRSGPGDLYLASPIVVAIAAACGRVVSPGKFFNAA
jgi:3-isopropylmalate/(R)-2-methylmalate dehydratase large subunit